MSRREQGILAMLVLAAIAIVALPVQQAYKVAQLDSAMAAEMVDNIRSTGIPNSTLAAEVLSVIDHTVTEPAGEVCVGDLPPPQPSAINMLRRHAYLLLYPLAGLTFAGAPEVILPILTGIAYVIFGAIVYVFLRRRGTSIGWAVAFALFITAQPVWSQSMFGQLYVDRFFLPLGLLFTVQAYDSIITGRRHVLRIISLGTLAACTTERAMFQVGITALLMALLWLPQARKAKMALPLMMFGFISLAAFVSFVSFFFVHGGEYQSLLSSLMQLPARLDDPHFTAALAKYLFVHGPLIVLAAFGGWRGGLLAVAAIGPNAIISIGGAEKLGWTTHYHVIYFPLLVFAALIGMHRLAAATNRIRLVAAMAFACLPLIVNPFGTSYGFAPQYMANHALVRAASYHLDMGTGAALRVQVGIIQDVTALVPPGAVVSTSEGFMPALRLRHDLHYYPLGLTDSDVVVVPVVRPAEEGLVLGGAVTYLGAENQAELDRCLTRRLPEYGFDLGSARMIHGFAVITK